MSEAPIASYTFLPFARHGLGGKLKEADQAVLPAIRASIALNLKIDAEHLDGSKDIEPVPGNVQLYGPGDIVGIDRAAIVRTEPRNLITNFETNFLPFVEFYEEDFPWRYTPSASFGNGRRMRPWLSLLVLAEEEFDEVSLGASAPLPTIKVINKDAFPTFDTLWAWAHVHVNSALGGDPNDPSQNATRLAATLADNRDKAYSRILSPRVLKANTGYHAFLIPSFESGRLAGLGKDPAKAAFPTQGAWVPGRTEEPDLYPIYHRWEFRTGAVGDFEYLVRLLKPQTVDPRVGHRPMDVQDPDANLPAIPELGGILRLGGALRAPLITLSDDDLTTYWRFEEWAKPYPHKFQTDMAALVNLAADYSDQTPTDANAASDLPSLTTSSDPLIVPPLYGRWHAIASKLDPARYDPELDHWVDELNLDPRHRTAAGLGTSVVQKNQETYMEVAWLQVGKVIEGNGVIRLGHMALLTSLVWHRARLAPLAAANDDQLLTITAPVHRRLMAAEATVGFTMRTSMVPPALMRTSFRKALRPRARVSRLTGLRSEAAASLIDRVNKGDVSAAPPKEVPPALPTDSEVADDLGLAVEPGGTPLPSWLIGLLRALPFWRFALIGIALLLALLLLLIPGFGMWLALLVVAASVALTIWLSRKLTGQQGGARKGPAAVFADSVDTGKYVDEMPTSRSFAVSTAVSASGEMEPPPILAPGPDTPTAMRFKDALRNSHALDRVERVREVPKRPQLDLSLVRNEVYAGIDPVVTIPRHIRAGVDIPPRIADHLVEDFGEIMVYPEIDDPMYEPLKAISDEFLLPNIQLLPMNSITLVETNQKFIEAYMVGLNHEFARELLWREYPTDQRGSYFRQFWDVTGFLTAPGVNVEDLRKRLFDITELHTWSKDSGLDEHDNREEQGDKEDELVLAIRGELLKKYPTAVVYAHRAAWERTSGGQIDKSRPRRLADLPEGIPPTTLVKTPLYEAKVAPDIYFFGFDLTAKIAKGGKVDGGEEDPGWFFVIKERPGEPRFGLDLPQGTPRTSVSSWNELSWSDVVDNYEAAVQLPIGVKDVAISGGSVPAIQKAQHDEDAAYRWRGDSDAAELAYILYQIPVLMAVHAAEMLKKGGADG